MARPLREYTSYDDEPTGSTPTTSETFRQQRSSGTISGSHRSSVTYRTTPANDNAMAANDNEMESRAPTTPGSRTTLNRASIQMRTARARQNIRSLKDARSGGVLNVKNAKTAARQGKAVVTFWSIITWATPLYVIQLVLALMSIAAFGLGGFVSYIFGSYEETDAGLVQTALEVFGDTFLQLLLAALKYIGIEIPDPRPFIGLFLFLPFLVGLATLVLMGIQYAVTLHNPLGGKKAGLKMNMFILALVGYFLPIFNLVPWALFWALVVLRYPK